MVIRGYLLVRGLVSYVPGLRKIIRRRPGGSTSAKYCYSVWLRHLVLAHESGLPTQPKVIAELGPGETLAVGLAALLTGSTEYHAFDVKAHANTEKNLQALDELVELFERRAPIPDREDFPRIMPAIESLEFPGHILTEERLRAALDKDRVEAIREAVKHLGQRQKEGILVSYSAPYYGEQAVQKDSIDLILSHAVLEHVDEVEQTYEILSQWLKPDGYMSHLIDYKSHNLSSHWNGHWTVSDLQFKIIRGTSPYFINRLPHSAHIDLLKQAGFKIVAENKTKAPSQISKARLAPRFKNLSEDDLTTPYALIQARKAA